MIATARLRIRPATLEDAPFVLELLNDPSFLEFIGDRGVRTPEQAAAYIHARFIDSYERHGYGLYVVEGLAAGAPMGLCGLVRRAELDGPDLGYAFLPAFRGSGFAFEAASAVVEHAEGPLGLDRLLAVADTGNARSLRVLGRLGFTFERMVLLNNDTAEVGLHVRRRAADRSGG